MGERDAAGSVAEVVSTVAAQAISGGLVPGRAEITHC